MGIAHEIEIQRRHFAGIARKYHEEFVTQGDEHTFALAFLVAMIDHFKFESILDIGSGTGRALLYIKDRKPQLQMVGIEPVRELRKVGYRLGIPESELIEGDATRLGFDDGQFDLVCSFGVLHHVRHPATVVTEMLRVARKGIFISDSNNFGQGSFLTRTLKQIINSLKLWRVADFFKTGGKGYLISKGDGLAYSYSVFNNYNLIQSQCKSVHILNTAEGNVNPYRSASHVAVFGIKKRHEHK